VCAVAISGLSKAVRLSELLQLKHRDRTQTEPTSCWNPESCYYKRRHGSGHYCMCNRNCRERSPINAVTKPNTTYRQYQKHDNMKTKMGSITQSTFWCLQVFLFSTLYIVIPNKFSINERDWTVLTVCQTWYASQSGDWNTWNFTIHFDVVINTISPILRRFRFCRKKFKHIIRTLTH
jgi:hypothetical protein